MLAWRPRLRASHEIRRQAGGRLKTKAPHTGRFCLWQNRSLFESNVQAACKHTTCCTRQQAQTTNGMRPMANPLNDIRLRTAPRKRRFCGQIEADHPAVNKRPEAVPRVAEGQTSMTNSLSPSECVAFAHKIAVEPLESHFKRVCTQSRGTTVQQTARL